MKALKVSGTLDSNLTLKSVCFPSNPNSILPLTASFPLLKLNFCSSLNTVNGFLIIESLGRLIVSIIKPILSVLALKI